MGAMAEEGGEEEDTYWARVKRIARMMDPRTALASDAQLQRAVETLRAAREGESAISPAELDAARRLTDAALHPDTGEKIFLPLRLSFIVPCNLVLDTLMLSARGTLQNVGAQWLNQTYNSLHYYANRNASNAESTSQIVQAYLGATAGSVGVAVGLNAVIDRVQAGSKLAPFARRLIPFCAVAAADVLNLGIMRKNEFLEGVNVFGPGGEELGKSRIAGSWAVGACIGGRIAAAAPILILPPLIMHRFDRSELFMRRPWLKTPALMGLVGVSIQVCVPVFFGMFKQQAESDVTSLEPHLHHLVDSQGRPVKRVTYNKGI